MRSAASAAADLGQIGSLRRGVLRLTAISCALCLLATPAGAGGHPALQPAEIMPLAARSLLLDGARRGDHVLVVGVRGHILASHDRGRTWSQAPVPTRSALTAVAMVTDDVAWAVGHDAVVLRSDDAGRTWQRVHFEPGADPFLDVRSEDQENVVAVGAYGAVARTADRGRTWHRTVLHPEGPHVNALTVTPSGTIFAACEFGLIFRSDDRGRSWRELAQPYQGSLFGALALSDTEIVVFGLRVMYFAHPTVAPAGTGSKAVPRHHSLLVSNSPTGASCWPGTAARCW